MAALSATHDAAVQMIAPQLCPYTSMGPVSPSREQLIGERTHNEPISSAPISIDLGI
jgi:hypothetical protein